MCEYKAVMTFNCYRSAEGPTKQRNSIRLRINGAPGKDGWEAMQKCFVVN